MNDPHDHNRTVDIPSTPPDSLEAALAAAFGKAAQAPRSSLGDMRPLLLKEAEGDSGHVVKPKSDAMPAPAEAGDRYQLSGEIARGGMGAVLRGRDVDLGRDLAVKVLLETHQGRTELVQRFVDEAQIAGQLQHPGIVPIYDMGSTSGKRPYFTMKLVKGNTLAKLLAARVAWAAADNALQIHGGNGFALEYPISRILCDARILSIFEGAAEIQAQVIARRLLEGGE